jgi:hypothetical protein
VIGTDKLFKRWAYQNIAAAFVDQDVLGVKVIDNNPSRQPLYSVLDLIQGVAKPLRKVTYR